MGVVIVGGEGPVLGLNLRRPIITNEDFATRLFPNHFGQYRTCYIIRPTRCALPRQWRAGCWCTCRWYVDGLELVGERSDRLLMSRIERRLSGKSVSCEASNAVGATRRSHVVLMRCKQTAIQSKLRPFGHICRMEDNRNTLDVQLCHCSSAIWSIGREAASRGPSALADITCIIFNDPFEQSYLRIY